MKENIFYEAASARAPPAPPLSALCRARRDRHLHADAYHARTYHAYAYHAKKAYRQYI